MSGKNSRLIALYSHKQLLIAASELNRAQMLGDVEQLAGEVQGLLRQARAVAAAAAGAGLLVAVITAFRPKSCAAAPAKAPWWKRLLQGTLAISNIWSALSKQSRP